ncbi:MAG TPA: hypothetical protein DDW52_15020 [Planctomycetaceae bacterium]|nr:hypothetical protein [Planctomycetaceae bacterium]
MRRISNQLALRKRQSSVKADILQVTMAGVMLASICMIPVAGAQDVVSAAPELQGMGAETGEVEQPVTDLLVSDAVFGSPRVPTDASWFSDAKVGYDRGFVIASQQENNLQTGGFPFELRFNGWGQLRHTITAFEPPSNELNQFQLVRGRLVFSGKAFNPDFTYFIQLDGRSTSGDGVRLLDYYLNYDIGHRQFGMQPGALAFRTGKYKVPFTMSRWLSGRDFEFADRSVSSIFFDVNRSFAWGLYGQLNQVAVPVHWEVAIFNGLVTGGAETGSSGTLDDNFAYSGRVFAYPIGQWSTSPLQDFDNSNHLAVRVGAGFATSTIERFGSTEFSRLRVVDDGVTLASILSDTVEGYHVSLFAVDASAKIAGWSGSFEYYFRSVDDFQGAAVSELFDHGFWLQVGKFVVPGKVQLAVRWSRVQGDSGSLGAFAQSAEEISAAIGWYFRRNQAKLVTDATYLTDGPINSSALDISPGNQGWLLRTQIQFSF